MDASLMKASALRLRFSQSLARAALAKSAAAVEPDGAFDHPTPGLDDEALHLGSLDLGLEIGQRGRGDRVEHALAIGVGALVAAAP